MDQAPVSVLRRSADGAVVLPLRAQGSLRVAVVADVREPAAVRALVGWQGGGQSVALQVMVSFASGLLTTL